MDRRDLTYEELRAGLLASPVLRSAARIAYYRRNPEAFFSDQLKVRTKEARVEPFNLWPCQRPVLDLMMKQMNETGMIRLVCLKARQVGCSVLSEAVMAWSTMLNPNRNGLIVAHDAATAETLFNFTKTYYDYLDADIKPMRRFSTRREIVLENPDDNTRAVNPGLGSKIVITSANNIHSGIGRSLHAVHSSEAARYVNAEGIVDGIFPALAKVPGSICIIESTARHTGLWFQDLCNRAKSGDSEFGFIFIPWYLQPGYQIPLLPGEKLRLSIEERHLMKTYGITPEQIKFFRSEMSMIGNEALFKQSYPFNEEEAFQTAGDNVFDWARVDIQRQNARKNPPIGIGDVHENIRFVDDPRGKLTVWELPVKGMAYDIGVDVALGDSPNDDTDDGRDWSTMCVLQRGSNRQVAEWRSKSVDTFELAQRAAWVGYWYNTAQIAVETNGVGLATSMHMSSKIGYPNLHIWRFRDEVVPKLTKKTGWQTSRQSKKWLVSFAVHMFNNDALTLRSERLLEEMRYFVRGDNDQYGAASGRNDDLVMAMLIALTTSDDENFAKWMGYTEGRVARAHENNPLVLLSEGKSPWNTDPKVWVPRPTHRRNYATWDY